MEKRILLVMTAEGSADRASAARDAAERARTSGGVLRMMYASRLPRARLDEHGRVVADVDREMARIAGDAEEMLRRLALDVEGVPVERVVRFGRLADEVATEAAVFAADLVALAAPPTPGLRHELIAWYLEWIALGSRTPVILLPAAAEGGDDRMREALAMTALRQICPPRPVCRRMVPADRARAAVQLCSPEHQPSRGAPRVPAKEASAR